MELKPGYKRTEVGVIPEHWESVEAGAVGRFRGGSGFPTRHQGATGGTYPFFKVSDMNNEGNEIFMFTSNNWISEAVRKKLGATAFPANSIVFAKVGAAIFLERKKVLAQASCIDNNMMALVLDGGRADYRFIHYLLLNITLGALVSTTALPSLSGKELSQLTFGLPPLPEQRSIAAALSDVDALIGALEKLIAKKRDLKQAAIKQLLTGKQRLPGFSGEWEVKRFGEIGATYGGLAGKTKADFGSGSARYIPFLNVMNNVVIDCENLERVRLSTGETQNRALKGDLFFNGSSETPEEVGMCAVLLHDVANVYLNSFCFGFRMRPEVEANGVYLAYFFRGTVGRRLMYSLAQGATRYNLAKTALLELEFRLPSLEEQTAIAAVLSDMDGDIEVLERRLAKTRALKQGMMQELLTGRTRLV